MQHPCEKKVCLLSPFRKPLFTTQFNTHTQQKTHHGLLLCNRQSCNSCWQKCPKRVRKAHDTTHTTRTNRTSPGQTREERSCICSDAFQVTTTNSRPTNRSHHRTHPDQPSPSSQTKNTRPAAKSSRRTDHHSDVLTADLTADLTHELCMCMCNQMHPSWCAKNDFYCESNTQPFIIPVELNRQL